MNTDNFDLVEFSSDVQSLLLSELDIAVGNMEVVGLSEKLYALVRAKAFNEELMAAKEILELKMEDVSEEIEFLVKYED